MRFQACDSLGDHQRYLGYGCILKTKLTAFADRLVWDMRDNGQLRVSPDVMEQEKGRLIK